VSEQKPTRVVGRRVVAYLIDGVIISAIGFGLFLLFTNSYPKSGFKNGIVIGNTRHAFASGSSNRTWWIVTWAVASILLLVVLPGLRGWTIGKLAMGIRVINAEGRPPGIWRSFVREILWIIDGIAVNLVAFITALATRANQRVGDLVAHTYVVRAGAAGRPIGELLPEIAGFPPQSQPMVAAGTAGQPPAPGEPQPVAAQSPAAESPAGQGGPGQPAGWYADPQGHARLRWWDGTNWTDNTSA
jgi:uncharacterized RDD family membrane protein YckC